MTPSLWLSGLALPPSKLDTDIHISSSTCSESITSTLINIVALTIWYLNQVDLAKEGLGFRSRQLNWSPTNSHQLVLVVNFSTVFGTCSAISSLDASAFTCTNSNLAFFIQICIISSGMTWMYEDVWSHLTCTDHHFYLIILDGIQIKGSVVWKYLFFQNFITEYLLGSFWGLGNFESTGTLSTNICSL